MQYRQLFSKTLVLLTSLYSMQVNAESLLPLCKPIFKVGYKEVLRNSSSRYNLYVNMSVVDAFKNYPIDRAHLDSYGYNPINHYEADTAKDGKAILKASSTEGSNVTLTAEADDFQSIKVEVPITQKSFKKGYINVLSSATIGMCKKSLY